MRCNDGIAVCIYRNHIVSEVYVPIFALSHYSAVWRLYSLFTPVYSILFLSQTKIFTDAHPNSVVCSRFRFLNNSVPSVWHIINSHNAPFVSYSCIACLKLEMFVSLWRRCDFTLDKSSKLKHNMNAEFICEHSLMVKHQLPKLRLGVRFPLFAPCCRVYLHPALFMSITQEYF